MDYNKIAKDIIKNVGGENNIVHAMHCATRLRLRLKNYDVIDEDKLTDIEEVKGVFLSGNQYQIILGSGLVNLVCDEVKKILGMDEGSAEEAPAEEEKGSIVQRGVKLLSDIFVPIIPAIVAGGLLMGIYNVLSATGLFVDGKSLIDLFPALAGIADMINMFSSAAFTFLPVLIGFSATKKFGGNAYLGAAMGMIMVHPNLMSAYSLGVLEPPTWNIFGMTIDAVGYQGTVLPVLAVSYILATIEKRLHKITPTWLDNLTTPLVSTLVTGFITFVFVGPILRIAGDGLASGLTWIYNTLGLFGGAILGLVYAPICLTGMHHSFIAIETQLIAASATTGGSFIFPIASMNNVAQGAAVIAVLLWTKDKKIKSVCSASGISAFLGITEPAMFGVTLKLRYPFYGAMIGSACGGAYIALMKVLALAMGTAGIPGFISIAPQSWVHFFIGLAISIVVSFVVTTILLKKFGSNEEAKKEEKPAVTPVVEVKPNVIYAPLKGHIKPIAECSDPMFASKAMGDGVVITPEEGLLVSPVNGSVQMVFPTKHAIGISAEDGTELLIHIGLDTVSLEGKPFETLVDAGDTITVGQPLIKIDLDMIKEAGLSTETPVVITNQKVFTVNKEGSTQLVEEMFTVK